MNSIDRNCCKIEWPRLRKSVSAPVNIGPVQYMLPKQTRHRYCNSSSECRNFRNSALGNRYRLAPDMCPSGTSCRRLDFHLNRRSALDPAYIGLDSDRLPKLTKRHSYMYVTGSHSYHNFAVKDLVLGIGPTLTTPRCYRSESECRNLHTPAGRTPRNFGLCCPIKYMCR